MLVVDDNLSLGNLVAHALGRIGHSCALESSVAGARTRLAAEPFDLILLENDLPDGKGVDLLSDAARGQSALIVLMSGAPSARLQERALELGAFEFMERPLSMERVAALASTAARPVAVESSARKEACP
ncbi:MAG: response regulator [Elusimicrobia bacterium]|nr:response regulator [Elusimicrobiota bacterium]